MYRAESLCTLLQGRAQELGMLALGLDAIGRRAGLVGPGARAGSRHGLLRQHRVFCEASRVHTLQAGS